MTGGGSDYTYPCSQNCCPSSADSGHSSCTSTTPPGPIYPVQTAPLPSSTLTGTPSQVPPVNNSTSTQESVGSSTESSPHEMPSNSSPISVTRPSTGPSTSSSSSATSMGTTTSTSTSLTPSSPSSSSSSTPSSPYTSSSPFSSSLTSSSLTSPTVALTNGAPISQHSRLSGGTVAGITVGSLAFLATMSLLILFFIRRQRKSRMPPSQEFLTAYPDTDVVPPDFRSRSATPMGMGVSFHRAQSSDVGNESESGHSFSIHGIGEQQRMLTFSEKFPQDL